MSSSITNANLESDPPTPNNTSATSIQASHDQPAAFVEFHLFPKLPKELRLQIAGAAVGRRAPSTFVVVYRPLGRAQRRQKSSNHGFYKHLVQTTRFPVPALLHVNTKLRGAALNVYALSFSGPLDNKPIYFNFAKDTLFFNSQSSFLTMKNGSSCSAWNNIGDKLRYMTFGQEFSGFDGSLQIIARFRKLKAFAHQSHDGDSPWHHRSATDAELRSVLEGNWSKSQEYEELVAATRREANLISEPALKGVYELPKIKALKTHEVYAIVNRL